MKQGVRTPVHKSLQTGYLCFTETEHIVQESAAVSAATSADAVEGRPVQSILQYTTTVEASKGRCNTVIDAAT